MKVLATSVLVFEAVVMGLFMPVAYFTGQLASGATALWIGGGLVLLCIVAAAMVRRPFGIAFGTVVQVLVVACGLLVPMMFLVGGVFAALWWAAIYFGRRGDAASAAAKARAAGATPDVDTTDAARNPTAPGSAPG